MSKRLTIKEINAIRKDSEAGLSVTEIAKLRGLSRPTVYAALSGETGKRIGKVADRMEYFNKQAAMYTGNSINGHPELSLEGADVVLDEIIFLEELQEFIDNVKGWE